LNPHIEGEEPERALRLKEVILPTVPGVIRVIK